MTCSATGRRRSRRRSASIWRGRASARPRVVGPATAIVQSVTRTWNDANGNFVPDCVLTDLQANGECGRVNNLAFGQPVTNVTLADDARRGWGVREYNYQTSVQLQHELRPGLGLAIGYFRTWWRNQTVEQNTAVTPSDFTEYCITAPTDPRLSTSGNQICGFYDVNPNKFGQVNRVVTRAKNFGTPEEIYNGVDMAVNARWGEGALLQGGVSVGRQTFDYCYANGHPELTPQGFPANYPRSEAFCRPQSPWWDGSGSQIKLHGRVSTAMGRRRERHVQASAGQTPRPRTWCWGTRRLRRRWGAISRRVPPPAPARRRRRTR